MIYPVFIPMNNGPVSPEQALGDLMALILIVAAILIWKIAISFYEDWEDQRNEIRRAEQLAEEIAARQKDGERLLAHSQEMAEDAERRRRNWMIDRIEEQVK